jgi:hypothetical protein
MYAESRLVEKFAVLGRDDIAEPLGRILPYVLGQDANVEILTLILALSDRPVDAAEFDESRFLVEKEIEKGVTWEEIVTEEPLVGDHWKEPDYEGSEEEDDWVYETTGKVIEEERVRVEERKEEVQVDEGTSKLADEFLRRQYWSRRKKYVVLSEDYAPELDFGGLSLWMFG